MYFGNVLHQCALPVPKCGGIGREGFLCILFKNKVGEILSMFFYFIFEYQKLKKIGKKIRKISQIYTKKKKNSQMFSISFVKTRTMNLTLINKHNFPLLFTLKEQV